MKPYLLKDIAGTKRIFADELGDFLVWPGTQLPFLKEAYRNHPRAQEIEALLRKAEQSDEAALESLWNDSDIINLTFKVSDAL